MQHAAPIAMGCMRSALHASEPPSGTTAIARSLLLTISLPHRSMPATGILPALERLLFTAVILASAAVTVLARAANCPVADSRARERARSSACSRSWASHAGRMHLDRAASTAAIAQLGFRTGAHAGHCHRARWPPAADAIGRAKRVSATICMLSLRSADSSFLQL